MPFGIRRFLFWIPIEVRIKHARVARLSEVTTYTYGHLSYTLDGNRLNRVDDAATAVAYNGGFEFTDRVKQANEYTYDENGNLTKDLNRNISEIRYNCLNLPSYYFFGSNNVNMQLHYRSDGKLMRRTYAGIDRPAEYYYGNVVYENSTAKRLLTEEGYVDLTDNSYHYFVRDHQGNNRVVVNGSGTVEEVNHYYPFGGLFATTGSVQPYKYNGKELLTQQGLNWYDYGARHYDATLGRFHTQDRYAEKYYPLSPYQYGANSPIANIDINGDTIVVNPCANGVVDKMKMMMGYDTKFQRAVKSDLANLKKDDSEVAAMIKTLESADKVIRITFNSNIKEGNRVKPDNENIDKPTGSTIFYDPYRNYSSKRMKKRPARVGLAHELAHSEDLYNGKGQYFNHLKKKNYIDFIKESEKHSLEMENRIRVKLGLPERSIKDYLYETKQDIEE